MILVAALMMLAGEQRIPSLSDAATWENPIAVCQAATYRQSESTQDYCRVAQTNHHKQLLQAYVDGNKAVRADMQEKVKGCMLEGHVNFLCLTRYAPTHGWFNGGKHAVGFEH